MKIYSIIFLHAHLPYINHINEDYIEENWYFENVIESYVPFLRMISNLLNDGIEPRFAISISPTLCYMMENENLQNKLKRYINLRLKLIETELKKETDERIIKNLNMYLNLYHSSYEFLKTYSFDLITPFKFYKNQGILEIITTPATYPILPFLINKQVIDLQITLASMDYRERFLHPLKGIFLSECAYEESVLVPLKKNSISYFFVDETSLDTTKHTPYSLYRTSNGINVFVRDSVSSESIIGESSYPSNPLYRDFYKDIGYERDIDYLKEFTLFTQRIPTGLKYYKIGTLSRSEKEIYEAEPALKQVEIDAEDFIKKRVEQFKNCEKSPLVVSCFNMEIFGHRWFEGIYFLEMIFRKVRSERYPIQFLTPSQYLSMNSSSNNFIELQTSSWSENGYFDKWLNERNDFIYPYIYEITQKYLRIVNKYVNSSPPFNIDLALRQLGREILLMHSSDWSVMINYDMHREYALYRLKKHYSNALKIIDQINSSSVDISFIKKLENENNIFHSLDWRLFASSSTF
jgi:1,4-alpha-glucan branching enzyme